MIVILTGPTQSLHFLMDSYFNQTISIELHRIF